MWPERHKEHHEGVSSAIRPTAGARGALTVRLPPAQVVSEVAVAGIQDHTSVEARGVQEGLLPEKLLPVEDVGGGELGGHVDVLLNTKLNSSLWPYAMTMSSSSSMTERALRSNLLLAMLAAAVKRAARGPSAHEPTRPPKTQARPISMRGLLETQRAHI
ncbi:hypothetical protein EYF80_051784 [Liparis tanakae]|uniref:Uncharacterized protein n=1 Tax=Liparis tanakae TaxID=230148 RepID=A0A4Z2FA29_9TELE|nr:hypothetical protein EYF80_051784 [Liparis tanakae]